MSNSLLIQDFKLDDDLLILSKLNPAETYLLLNKRPKLIELLKLTMLDLMLKQVLVVKEEEIEIVRDGVYREYTIVETGVNFRNHSSKEYENYFFNDLNEDVYFHLKSFVKKVVESLPKDSKYFKNISHNSAVKDCFSKSLLPLFLRKSHLNQNGDKLSNKIKLFLDDVDLHIGDLITQDKEKGLEVLMFLKGNIFLLENLDFKIFDSLKLENTIKNTSHSWANDADFLWYDFFDTIDFNHSFDDIEDSFSSFDNSSFFDGYSDSSDSSYDFDFD